MVILVINWPYSVDVQNLMVSALQRKMWRRSLVPQGAASGNRSLHDGELSQVLMSGVGSDFDAEVQLGLKGAV